jgi:hypothetical protein
MLTLTEVATMLRISKAHASKLCRGLIPGTPPLPAVRLGRRVLVQRSELFHWINKNNPSSVHCVQR